MTPIFNINSSVCSNKLHIFISVHWPSPVKRNVLSLINHNAYNPCRALRGLQDSTESLVCQEIQEKQDPQATLPTLG